MMDCAYRGHHLAGASSRDGHEEAKGQLEHDDGVEQVSVTRLEH